ncbi:hypothetical protein RhiirA5_439865 [Rhizophagus irregularis]|uniref:Uncharacterized protein n=1 Tax=Rhizophagus irregularis TaxID=588596 RepID=A0A2N0NHD6_9GLOM|nr:hypothetical protein RhiirA5_439865 [Rhizophagus irregularis]
MIFIGYNINRLGSDHSKLNLLTKYYSNKGANIIDNKIKGSEVCIMINKKWENHIRKIRRLGAYYIEA